MERNKIIHVLPQDMSKQHQESVAFHEAGHAVGIYSCNKAKGLPTAYFRVVFKDLDGFEDAVPDGNYEGRVEGGRLIQNLPVSIEELIRLRDRNETLLPRIQSYLTAFEADMINLLMGPMAEARYIYSRDAGLFNRQTINLKALEHYGGESDLVLVRDYLKCFSADNKQQNEKLDRLFEVANDFVIDWSNWSAITKLAKYFLRNHKNVVNYEEIVSVLES